MPALLEIDFRHSAYFLGLLEKAGLQYKTGGAELASALTLYQSNRENIQRGEEWSARWFSRDDRIAAICIDYPGIAYSLLESIQNPVNIFSGDRPP